MIIMAYFSEEGTPKTGLTPKIDIWDSDLNHPIIAQDMTEIAGGFYKYNFANFDNEKDYCIRADGGSSLKDADRYVIAASEIVGETEDIKIETDKIQPDIIDSKEDYKADLSGLSGTINRILGLAQENYRLFDISYDTGSRLISLTIKIYPTANDCDNDTNAIAEYHLTASYQNGDLSDYKVTKI